MVLGISRDSAKKHRKFKEKYKLPYPLLVDEEARIATAYDIMVEKSMYGKKYIAPARTTFVIDKTGRIAHVFENVKPENHAAAVAEVVTSLSKK